MQTGPEQFPMEHSSWEWDRAGGNGALPWLSGLPGHFYTQHTLHVDRQPDAQDRLRATNSTIFSPDYSWDDSRDILDRNPPTGPSFYDRAFKDGDDKRQMFTLQSSTSTSASVADFKELPRNNEIFEPNSPLPPNSPSEESDSLTGFSSTTVPTVPSSESNPQSSRRLSRVSSLDSEKHDPISCSNCSTNTTSLWRRTRDGLPICNACGLFERLHGIPRPLSLKTDIVKKRKRDRASGPSLTGGKSGGSRSRATRNLVRGPSMSESKRG
jgi:GATA zinc finger